MSRLVDVYVYRKEQNRVKVLVLKRAEDVVYGGQWRMIGGKVKASEKAYEAALRELQEEISLEPQKFWTLPSINQFYDYKTDTIHQIPAFAVKVDQKAIIQLDHEHDEFKWISKNEIKEYISWPEQQRLMHLLFSIVTNNEILEEWIIQDQS